MKGDPELWESIASFRALCRASHRAARGKRSSAAVARWLADLEPRCLELERELREERWCPGRAATFRIHDPKERTITAAPFEDRVVHHALMDALEPAIDAALVPETFACRRGKGAHAALAHARRLVRRHGWFLKLDVRRFFPSIEHDLALAALGRVTGEPRALRLAGRIVRAGAGGRAGGRGLPIGNLTSQWLANLLLDPLDRLARRLPGVHGYARYMDDLVLFADGKAELRAAAERLGRFLPRVLRLEWKERATLLAPARQGLPFLGRRIHPGATRLRPANLRRIRSRLKHRARERALGRIDECRFQDAVRASFEHLRLGGGVRLRRRFADELRRHAPP